MDSERLPLVVKLAYGAPSFAGSAMAIPIAIHLTKFYADVVVVPLGALGMAIALARAFDAVTDPLMGWVSDRTRTRWGRRRPYLAIGAPLCAVAFFALFTPPADLSGGEAIVWFGVTFALYYLFHTVYLIPHFALGPELTLDYHERSSLYGIREACVVLGTLCAALAPGLLALLVGSERTALSLFGAIFGGLLVVLYGWLVVRVRERPEFARRASNPLVPGIRRVLGNAPFRILLGTSLMGQVAGILAGSMMPFYTHYVLQPERPTFWLSIFLAVYFGSGLLFLPFWLRAARRLGKRPVWWLSFLFNVSGASGLFFLGAGDLLAAGALLAWAGAGFGAASFLSLAIKADVIDHDELLTGRRREAQFTAMWSILPKFVAVPGAAIPIALLGSMGYVPNAEQTPEVQTAIRALFALGTAAASALGLGIALRFPITQAVHGAIRDAIQGRAAGEVVVDPVSGRTLPPPSSDADDATTWYLDHFSPGELRRVMTAGPRRLLVDVCIATIVALAIASAASLFVLREIGDARGEPGALAVLGVVVAGFAFSTLLFHGVRIQAARRFARRGIPMTTLRAHLDAAGAPSPSLERPELSTRA